MKSPLKYHGGKYFLADRIVALMPPHLTYVEPYFGGGSVMFAKNPNGVSEVANDIDKDLSAFWWVMQNDAAFQDFKRILEATPFSEVEFEISISQQAKSQLYQAVNFFIRCRQSLAGRMKSFAALTKGRTRRGMNEQVSAWLSAVEGLPEVHARLRRVLILNRDALDVIRTCDAPTSLLYLDPPYFPQTRRSPNEYAHEMSEEGHHNLLTLIRRCQGKVMISGYQNAMYEDLLGQWHRVTWDVPNHAAAGETKQRMTECLWMNFKPEET